MVRKNKILILMKNNDRSLSDIQNTCNTVSDWLIQKINNPIETNETISCACCHIDSGTSRPLANSAPNQLSRYKVGPYQSYVILNHSEVYRTSHHQEMGIRQVIAGVLLTKIMESFLETSVLVPLVTDNVYCTYYI